MTDARVEPLQPAHREAVQAFFGRIPEGDRTFFAEDVADPGLVDTWLADERGKRSVALRGDDVVGYVAVLPLVGWSSHVGSLRLVVEPDARGTGVGRALARAGLLTSLERGLSKTVVEVVAAQVHAIEMFSEIGFEPEALLRDHVRDRNGDLQDLVVLAHLVEGAWSDLAATGVEDALA